MDHSADGFPAGALTRRQFGLLLAGGAILLAGGGMYGVIARTEGAGAGASSFATSFGKVTILRAGRFAWLDAHGRTALSNLEVAVSHFNGGAGTNARLTAVQASSNISASGGHNHHGGVANPDWPQPVNLTWGDVVVLETEVQNNGAGPVLFSPGQLRLKLGRSDVTVTPQDSDHSPGSLAAHGNEHVLISYLAPHDVAHFELEFADDQHGHPRRLPLPLPATTEVVS